MNSMMMQTEENLKTTDDAVWYDDAFQVIEKTLWQSYDKEGNSLVSALDKQMCIDMTRFYLKGQQEGWNESESRTYSGVVGGKL